MADEATSVPLVDGRYLALDEQGTGLRATWRPAHGFVNLTLWRGHECVESFHLTPVEASNLVAFLTASLASTQPRPSRGPLRLVADGRSASVAADATTGIRSRAPDLAARLMARIRAATRTRVRRSQPR